VQYFQLWYSAFLYYGAGGSGDPFHMSLNAFTTYLVGAAALPRPRAVCGPGSP